ncbi:MAG: Gfo/Idh/MocA family oxidoreductase, partial [Akkermansiaceae bacterium]
MKQSTKVCIVGLGRAGRFHLASIKKLDSIELKYVVDPALSIQDDIVQNNDFILLEDIDEALADDELDAAIISPPTQFH